MRGYRISNVNAAGWLTFNVVILFDALFIPTPTHNTKSSKPILYMTRGYCAFIHRIFFLSVAHVCCEFGRSTWKFSFEPLLLLFIVPNLQLFNECNNNIIILPFLIRFYMAPCHYISSNVFYGHFESLARATLIITSIHDAVIVAAKSHRSLFAARRTSIIEVRGAAKHAAKDSSINSPTPHSVIFSTPARPALLRSHTTKQHTHACSPRCAK